MWCARAVACGFHGVVPPTGRSDHGVGSGEVEAYAAGFQARAGTTDTVAVPEVVDRRVAIHRVTGEQYERNYWCLLSCRPIRSSMLVNCEKIQQPSGLPAARARGWRAI